MLGVTTVLHRTQNTSSCSALQPICVVIFEQNKSLLSSNETHVCTCTSVRRNNDNTPVTFASRFCLLLKYMNLNNTVDRYCVYIYIQYFHFIISVFMHNEIIFVFFALTSKYNEAYNSYETKQ